MKHFSFKKQNKYRSTIEITAMVDLVFILLAFFMATSTMKNASAVNVDLPKTEKSNSAEDLGSVITVTKNNEIYFNEKKCSIKELANLLKVSTNVKNTSKIIIRGDKQADYEVIVQIMDQLNKVNVANFILSTEE